MLYIYKHVQIAMFSMLEKQHSHQANESISIELQKVGVNTLSITTEMYAKVTTFIYR